MTPPVTPGGYLTRDGTRAVVYAVDCGSDFPVQGAVYAGPSIGWIEAYWRADGRHEARGESPLDLMMRTAEGDQ